MSTPPNGKKSNRLAVLLPLCGLALAVSPMTAFAAKPRVLADGYKLELIAKEPEIVTPISMAFDGKGRLLVIESHTHERPEDYKGPEGDRLRMLADSDGDGRLDHWSTFAEGYQQAMNLCVRPDGAVYLVTRRDVRVLRDADDDGAADKEETLIKLETEDQYPHNGLSGIAFDLKSDGGVLYLGFGENHGLAYKFTGSDGVEYADHGGAGLIFRCGPAGEKLERFATGFWNPFSLCLAKGGLFGVDNDPDASPPCRLIHVVHGGDYGHRYEYNRAGTHPLQAWNGELPGTLPMVCGTGEAPTAVAYHRGYLWVTSWGDHRIERYELTGRGASFSAKLKTVVQGDADFRPTGLAVSPDGSIYFADWVDRSYPVHGQGRIWRLTIPETFAESPSGRSIESIADPFARHRLVDGLLEQSPSAALEMFEAPKAPLRLCALQSLRFRNFDNDARRDELLQKALADDDADVRLYAMRWIADERIAALRDDVARLLEAEMPTERYFLAVLAALDWLDGDTEMRSAGISNELLIRELENEKRSPQLHALALRLISPGQKWLTVDRLRSYLKAESLPIRLEAVRTLAMRNKHDRWPVLAEIAADAHEDASIRADAIAGLAEAAGDHLELLEKLAAEGDSIVAQEATRTLRLTAHNPAPVEEKPDAADLDDWNKLLSEGGDAESGRRLFFTGAGARCAACHQHSGRGGRIGPDLTRIGRQQSRERIIASILQPSREIAPEFQPWTLITADGVAHAGLRLPKGGDDGKERYADANGKQFVLLSEEIELREPSEKSIMPDGLERTLTIADLRDLVAFLSAAD
jgi:putative membrane-bound dehydrogenase-like protein